MLKKIILKGKDRKDKTISFTLKTLINENIKKFGRINNLIINTNIKNIELDIFLEGEDENIHVLMNDYKIEEKENLKYLNFSTIETSKKWINIILNEYFDYYKFKIPDKFAGIIQYLI